MPHLRGYSALRRGRYSAPGYVYFLTICTADRVEALTDQDVGAAIQEEIIRMSSEDVWQVRAFTLMPDHVHLLAELGESLSLSQAVARLKAKTKPTLLARDAKWQVNYFDHRMAASEPVLRGSTLRIPEPLPKTPDQGLGKMALVLLSRERMALVQRPFGGQFARTSLVDIDASRAQARFLRNP
jgi:REP element-mobilizing transposase RayT